jgi:hypothetical protein
MEEKLTAVNQFILARYLMPVKESINGIIILILSIIELLKKLGTKKI